MNHYAGIGSRKTPKNILELFTKLGKYLAKKNYILRSGHAEGADLAFENGCDSSNSKKEIYLPWKSFNGSNSELIVAYDKAFEIAQQFHPYWYNLKDGAKKLQARNSHQVLGNDLETPSKFVICWTEQGLGSGGTGQALRIAKHYEIPIFDFGKYNDVDEMKGECKKFLKNFDL